MIILQINTADKKGGAARVAYSLKKEFEKIGHQAPMLVGRKYSEDPDIILLNDIRSFSGKLRRKLSYWLANDIDVFSSDHLLKSEGFKKADIVHCHNLHSNYFNLSTLSKISKLKPVIWTFHDMWPLTAHCAHAFDGKIKDGGFFTCPGLDIYPPIAWHNEKYLENKKSKIYKNSDFHIVTPSKWLADKVRQSILKDKPISVIYNGINTSVFNRRNKHESRQALDLPRNKFIILVVAKGGQSNPWKGGNYVQEAIKAFRTRTEVLFVNLGGDTHKTSNNVKMVDFISNEVELANYYSAADMLLYPSIADNCPLVVLEAMACGLPIVSFKTGGIPELVEHKTNGYIAEYKDGQDLISGIDYILNLDQPALERMKQSSISTVREKFTVDIMTKNYIQLYEKLGNRK